jgi:hypothetical protein
MIARPTRCGFPFGEPVPVPTAPDRQEMRCESA